MVAAQLAGRDDRRQEPPCADLDVLIDTLADGILELADRPYAFFGHSMGAFVAFELARRLRDRGAAGPARLFVSSAAAPQIARCEEPLRFIDGDRAFLDAVATRYGGLPLIVRENPDLLAGLAPALRADLSVTETYVYREAPPLGCPIDTYGGAADPIVSAEALLGWREQTTEAFSNRMFDGGHFYLNRGRDALLADIMSRLLPA